MDSTILGLVLDSSAVIAAERKKQPIPDFIESVFRANGAKDLALSQSRLLNSFMESTVRRHRTLVNAAVSTSRSSWNWFQSTPLPIGQGGL
jgi:hypothetical protein